MEYKLSKKAYKVGEPSAISRFKTYGINSPEDLIGTSYAETPGKAKAEFAHNDYVSFTSLRCVRCPEDDLYLFEGKEKTMHYIQRTVKHREWRKRLSGMAEDTPNKKVLIYSGQWGSYWRSNSAGYTSNTNEAGVYTAKDAWDNVSHCGPEKLIDFRDVPVLAVT